MPGRRSTTEDAAARDARKSLRLRCPTCGKRFARDATDAPPFCSERCKLLDLGDWLDERYRIAGDPAPDPTGEHEPE